MPDDLIQVPLALIFAIILVTLLALTEMSRRYGAFIRDRGGDSVATMEAAILGLLSLMLGFTFSMALSRYEARRDAVVQEANTIGTLAWRATLLPAPHAAQTIRLLRDYTNVRLELTQRMPSRSELEAGVLRSNALQRALWQEAAAVAARYNTQVPTGLFIQSMNEMFDSQDLRLNAVRARMPTSVMIVLYSLAIVACALTGYAVGLESQRSRLPAHLLVLLVASVLLLIEDLDRPTSGIIRVSQQAMIDVAAGLVDAR